MKFYRAQSEWYSGSKPIYLGPWALRVVTRYKLTTRSTGPRITSQPEKEMSGSRLDVPIVCAWQCGEARSL